MKKITQTRYFQILTLFEQQPNKKFTYRELSQIMGEKPRVIEHVMKYLIKANMIVKFPNLKNMRECFFLLNPKPNTRLASNTKILIRSQYT